MVDFLKEYLIGERKMKKILIVLLEIALLAVTVFLGKLYIELASNYSIFDMDTIVAQLDFVILLLVFLAVEYYSNGCLITYVTSIFFRKNKVVEQEKIGRFIFAFFILMIFRFLGDIIGCFAGVTNKIDTKDILPIAIVIIFYLFGFILFCDKCINLIRNNENEKRSMPALVVMNISTFLCFALCVIGVFYFGLHFLISETIAFASIGVFAYAFFYYYWRELMIRMKWRTEEELVEKEERIAEIVVNLLFSLPSSISAKARLTAKIVRCIFLALFILVFLILFIWLDVITFASVGFIIAFLIWLINGIKEAIEIHAEIEYYKKKEAEEAKKAEEDNI